MMLLLPLWACFPVAAMLTFPSRAESFVFESTNHIQARPPSSLHSSSRDGDETLATKNPSNEQPNKYPRAAVSVALRCECRSDPYYLLIRRGNEPNKGKWALPGGKLEWGEPTLEGAKRELSEEIVFDNNSMQDLLQWHSEPYAAVDAIAEGFHYLIAVCFAECQCWEQERPPKVEASDDAIDAKWWSMAELDGLEAQQVLKGTRGMVQRLKRTESMYQKGLLGCRDEE